MNRLFKFENKEYLDFIRRLPCCVEGKSGDNIHAHHAYNEGRGGMKNDYTSLPLSYKYHVGKASHITWNQLTVLVKRNLHELIMFYNALYMEYIAGRYDLDADECCNFIKLKRKQEGLE